LGGGFSQTGDPQKNPVQSVQRDFWKKSSKVTIIRKWVPGAHQNKAGF
jgi:hypothetical protein